MSSDIMNNQAMKDVAKTASQPVTLPGSSSGKRQEVADITGSDLPSVNQQNQQASEVSEEKIREVVEQLNNHAQTVNRDLQFSVDDDSGKTVIKVINSETAELVRQIPSEEVLRISQTIRETLEDNKGIIVQTSA